MALRSMTGFARHDAEAGGFALRWEVKSVNGRNLDLRLRLPHGFERFEQDLRTIAGKSLFRGHVSATLSAERRGRPDERVVDEARLEAILAVTDRLVAEGRAAPPSADGLLALKGVLDRSDEASNNSDIPDDLEPAVAATFEEAVDGLLAARAGEGHQLSRYVEGLIDRIEELTRAARDERSRDPEIVKRRIAEQVKRLDERALDEQRLVQELALIAAKADVAEEIDRLESHVAAARELLVKKEPVGRRFDFLAQEMNRESNTICSKSNSVSLTAIGLDMKVAVDQLREQVQNIE